MPFATLFGSIFGAQLMALMVKFFQTIEVISTLSHLNAAFGIYLPFMIEIFDMFTLPAVIPETMLLKDPAKTSREARVKTVENITEKFENIFILSLRTMLATLYILTWLIYLIGSSVKWFGVLRLRNFFEYLMDLFFGMAVFDLTFVAIIEISENKKVIQSFSISFELVSLLVSITSLLLISLNIAFYLSSAENLRRKICVEKY